MVAAAVVGSAALGYVGQKSASSKASNAANRATDAQSAAAAESAALGREELDFTKQQYADSKPMRDAAAAKSLQVSDAQLESMKQNDAIAKDYYDYQTGTFRPLEKGIVADAQAFDTPERRAEAAASARADVEQSFGSAQDATRRAVLRTGGSVGSGRSLALMQDAALSKAKASAGATTSAARNVETQGYARKMDAASLGRGLASNQATSASVAINAGNSASANGARALDATNAGVGAVQSGYGGAMQGAVASGNLYGQIASSQQRLAEIQGQQAGQLGQAAGQAAAMYFSDEEMKSDTGKVTDGEEELDEINATPVETGWRYDPAKGGPDDGGRRHTGPMAQQVRRTMGDEVAPGGKAIDVVSMNGKLIAGMQALTKRVARIEQRVAA